MKTSEPPNASRLPLRFDAAGLAADLATLPPGEWTRHFNTNYYDGDWSGIALRSRGNGALDDNPHAGIYRDDAALLARLPHIAAAVRPFTCPLRTVRLLKLAAGSNIREHRDYDLGFEAGEVRIHIPIQTNADVEFYLGDRRIVMQPGEAWYLNLNLPHRVQNRSTADRIHLVLDCRLDDWLAALITRDGEAFWPEPGAGGFAEFRRLVLNDGALQRRLAALEDKREFFALAARLGAERGCDFGAGDVEAAFNAGRRAWSAR